MTPQKREDVIRKAITDWPYMELETACEQLGVLQQRIAELERENQALREAQPNPDTQRLDWWEIQRNFYTVRVAKGFQLWKIGDITERIGVFKTFRDAIDAAEQADSQEPQK